MYIQHIPKKTAKKTYYSTVLMENYRDKGKVRHRIISNLTKWPKPLVKQLEDLLKGRSITRLEDLQTQQGKACGGLIVIKTICKRLGIIKALGNNKAGLLALVLIMGRILTQGSRLHLAESWAPDQAIEEILGIDKFDEDQLYETLDWLSENQERIENSIFNTRCNGQKIRSIYLYDVTSSYLEGSENELADYGYNRDGKKGKKQIVIGLLCDQEGMPVSTEVFRGNTSDVNTVVNQLRKLQERFGVERLVFVGDRGMLKSAQISEITNTFHWHFITAITKPQIEALMKKGVFSMELFDEKVVEIEQAGIRYILRCNPLRKNEIAANRTSKITFVTKKITEKNQYLALHPRASVEVALRQLCEQIKRLKLQGIMVLDAQGRKITHHIDRDVLAYRAQLDGCYVIKTDVSKEDLSKQAVHDRYKDLTLVEQAFRTIKTTVEEIRPVYVRKESRTRGHVFVCMLAYLIVKTITEQLAPLNMTRKRIFQTLDKIQYTSYLFENQLIKLLPSSLLDHQRHILQKLDIKLPSSL
jgi:transposase